MAHFAKIENGIVTQVLVVANVELLEDGIESEAKGVQFLESLFGSGTWVQTSYSGSMRKNFAGIGYSYDAGRNAFIAPKPYPSWSLNEDTCRWDSPIPYPTEGGPYIWNEETQTWD